MSINLERTLEDHNIPEGLQYENLIEIFFNAFLSMLISIPYLSSFEHVEGSRREIRDFGT